MTRRRSTVVLSLLAGATLATGIAVAQQADEKKAEKSEAAVKLPMCPVMGEPVNFAVFTKTDDGPVYFCCKMCVKKYEKETDKYADAVKEQRAMLAKMPRVQVTCPMSGEPIDTKVYAEQDGEKVYFCCAGCRGKYTADPSKFSGKLAGSYTYQTKCPVMGKDIDPTAFISAGEDMKIYFCCPGCDEKFASDPEKYADNLEKQGLKLNSAMVSKIKEHANKTP